MADPTNPTPDPTQIVATTAATENQTEAMNDLKHATTEQGRAFASLNAVSGLVKDGFEDIENAAQQAGVSLGNLNSLSDKQVEKFGFLTTAFVNAREAFSGFAGVDYSGLSTFTDQLKDIKAAIEKVPAAQAAEAASALKDSLIGAGASVKDITAAYQKGTGALFSFAENFLKHADNMNRAQTAYVQMAARTGELGNVWSAAGAHLRDMDDLLEKQQQMLKLTREATGLSAKQVEDWYSQLGQIPGALNAATNMMDKSGNQTSMLTAVIRTATGTGRDMKDVMTDLNTAFKDYGLVGEKALLFSTRMSDISTRLKAPINDVTAAIRASADAFKMFATGQDNAAKSTESMAKFYDGFGKALESTGLSASASMELLNNQMQVASKFNIGQLSFIAQRTGGAGGLMGAAQETLKLQTDPGAVVKDAMDTLKQQFGQIVTVKDAANNQAAASMWIKQSALLQQLLGPLAPNQAAANRMLEAMKNQDAGSPDAIASALSDTSVQDAAQKGADMQAKSYGVLTDSRNLLEQIRDLSDRGVSRMMERTTGGATRQVLSLAQGELKSAFTQHMRTAAAAGGPQVVETAREMAKGNVESTAGRDFAASMHQYTSAIKEIPAFLRGSTDAIAQAFRSGDNSAVEKQMLEEREAAYAQVGSAARTSVDNTAPAFKPGMGDNQVAAGAPIAPTTNIHITGRFTMDCPYCHKSYDVTPQMGIMTGPAGQAKQ